MVVYLHAGPFARYVVDHLDEQLARLSADDRGSSVGSEPVPVAQLGPGVKPEKAAMALH
jgi:hypothetical protein